MPGASATSRPATSEPCAPQARVQRCTQYGPLGPWDAVVNGRNGTLLTLAFTGSCSVARPIDGSDPNSPYRAAVKESDKDVTVFVYGFRPYSNLCAARDEIQVRLVKPIGGRRLRDGYDGKSR